MCSNVSPQNAMNFETSTPMPQRSKGRFSPEMQDDEARRKQRRRTLDRSKALNSSTCSTASVDNSLSPDELKEHFYNCLNLFADNNLTAINVWKLKLITNLDKLKGPFSMAGTSLDISAKIYGIKVDDAHSTTMKLANMLQAQAKDVNDEGDDMDASNADAVDKKRKKQRYRKRTGDEKPTVAKDPKSLVAPIKTVDSYFIQPNTGATSNPAENLLTSNLPIDRSGYNFYMIPEFNTEFETKDITFENTNKVELPDCWEPVQNFKICQAFSNFDLITYNPDDYAVENDKSILSQMNDHNIVAYDEEGLPVPELDGSINDIFENAVPDDRESVGVTAEPMEIEEVLSGESRFASKIRTNHTLTIRNTEYSYNTVFSTVTGKVMENLWAGPSHWKLKSIRHSAPRFSGRQQIEERKQPLLKRKREKIVSRSIEDDPPEVDLLKTVKTTVRSTKEDPIMITLPIMQEASVQKLINVFALMSKPCVRLDLHEKSKSYATDGASATAAAAEEMPQFDDDHSDVADDEAMEEVHTMNQVEHDENEVLGDLVAENFVSAPDLVQKVELNFLRKPKALNMKKLKAAVWSRLCERFKKTAENGRANFYDIYKEVPCLLDEKMRNDLNSPTAFFALLHLANEHNLKLIDSPNRRDLYIEPEKK